LSTFDFLVIDGGPVLCHYSMGLRGESISLRVTILASGSSGNCTLLETGRTRLLVDAGLGKKETLRRLAAVERQVDRLDGIVISHEHSDHIGSLAQVLGQWRTTVYLTEATHAEVNRILPENAQKRLDRVEHIRAGHRFLVGDIEVSPISIPHDAADPLGFTFRANGVKVAIVTDLGYLPELVKFHLRDSDCLMLESNHDLEMLKVGPYPWHVKQRVMSRTGHLSNHMVSEFLADAEGFDGRARYVVLAHLSENNNNPDVARISAEEALGRRTGAAAFSGELMVASQTTPLPTLDL
jgi:phosphoribosyl 1,2-cyclic phosphodiesterase